MGIAALVGVPSPLDQLSELQYIVCIPPALHGPALHGRGQVVKGLLDPQVPVDHLTLEHVGHGVLMASTHWACCAQCVPVWVGPC